MQDFGVELQVSQQDKTETRQRQDRDRGTQVYSGILRYTHVHSGTLRYTQIYSDILNEGSKRLRKV